MGTGMRECLPASEMACQADIRLLTVSFSSKFIQRLQGLTPVSNEQTTRQITRLKFNETMKHTKGMEGASDETDALSGNQN